MVGKCREVKNPYSFDDELYIFSKMYTLLYVLKSSRSLFFLLRRGEGG